MSAHHTPEIRNDLEQKLLDAQEGRLELDDFMNALFEAQLFMPVHEGRSVANIQVSNKAKPLSLRADDGTEVLVLFTSPERAKSFVKDYPGYEGGILTDLSWIFEHLGTGFGISLNPGHEIGLDLEPESVAQLARKHLH
jgi:hypothetical protein